MNALGKGLAAAKQIMLHEATTVTELKLGLVINPHRFGSI